MIWTQLMVATLLLSAVTPPSVAPLPHVVANKGEIDSALTIVFSIVGAVSLLIIVVSGFRYVISRDDSQAVARARNSIIFAVVGLAVSVLAISIVGFVAGSL